MSIIGILQDQELLQICQWRTENTDKEFVPVPRTADAISGIGEVVQSDGIILEFQSDVPRNNTLLSELFRLEWKKPLLIIREDDGNGLGNITRAIINKTTWLSDCAYSEVPDQIGPFLNSTKVKRAN